MGLPSERRLWSGKYEPLQIRALIVVALVPLQGLCGLVHRSTDWPQVLAVPLPV